MKGSHTSYKLVAGSGYMESVLVHCLYLELEYVNEVLNGRLEHLAALHAGKMRETNAPLQRVSPGATPTGHTP